MLCRNTDTAKNHAKNFMNRAQNAHNEDDSRFFQTQAQWWATQAHLIEERADDLLKEIELAYLETATVPVAYYIDHIEEVLWIYFGDDDDDSEYYMIE